MTQRVQQRTVLQRTHHPTPGLLRQKHVITRRERPKSAPYLRLKNIQGTTIGKIWKNFFFKKIDFDFFLKKSLF